MLALTMSEDKEVDCDSKGHGWRNGYNHRRERARLMAWVLQRGPLGLIHGNLKNQYTRKYTAGKKRN
jgi:hypothetical protein